MIDRLQSAPSVRPATNNSENTLRPWWCLELSIVEYCATRQLQQRIVAASAAGHLETDVVLLLEHQPVFTLGRRALRDHLLVSDTFLATRGIPLVATERGGDITYHGPGQLVIYPIVNLRRQKLGAAAYVERLEELMLGLAAEYGVTASRCALNRGVWVGSQKLGSIGVAVSRGIAYHGLAFNVALDLTPFGWINPCGLTGVSMTSLVRQAGVEVSMAAVRQSARRQIETLFGCRLTRPNENKLERLLAGSEPAEAILP